MFYQKMILCFTAIFVLKSVFCREIKEPQKYDKIGIGVSFNPWNKKRKEIGYAGGVIYSGLYFIESEGVWKNRQPASISRRVKQADIDKIIKRISKEFPNIKPIFTYSEWKADAPRNASLGMYTTDLLYIIQKHNYFSIRLSVTEGDYNRSKWYIFKGKEFNGTIFPRLKKCVSGYPKAEKLVDGLRLYWKHNYKSFQQRKKESDVKSRR